jgi:hypothetical protein
MIVHLKNRKPIRSPSCGCLEWVVPREKLKGGKRIPLLEDMKHILLIERTMEMEKEDWSMQLHRHPTICEYWYVIKGKGLYIEGKNKFEVKEGDLIQVPPEVTHKIIGDLTFLCFMPMYNKDGMAPKKWYEAVGPLESRPPGISPPVRERSD